MGTLPPPRFTSRELREGDVDFCYGSRDGQLWPILDRIFELNLKFETTEAAINQRKKFLRDRKIGICDIVESAERKKLDASDLGMQNVVLRNLIGYLQQYANVDTLLFTGGNSKNGPEYFFRKQLKEHDLKLEVVQSEVPRIHRFTLPPIFNSRTESHRIRPEKSLKETSDSIDNDKRFLNNAQSHNRVIRTVSLTAPSGAANRAVGSLQAYKDLKDKDPDFNTFDFRVMQYRKFF